MARTNELLVFQFDINEHKCIPFVLCGISECCNLKKHLFFLFNLIQSVIYVGAVQFSSQYNQQLIVRIYNSLHLHCKYELLH